MAITNEFVMQAARQASEGGLAHLGKGIQALELAVRDTPSLAFDLAKALVEDVCKAVLNERSIPFDTKDDLPKLFKAVCQQLPLLPATASGEAAIRNSLERTLNGLKTTVQGICELRNQCGFASHGSGGPKPAMETVQALLAAQAADAVVGFIYRVHRQDRTLPAGPRLAYDDNPDFNASVDEQHDVVRIFELEFRPSEVLFQMDPEGYRNYLAQFEPMPETQADEAKAIVGSENVQ